MSSPEALARGRQWELADMPDQDGRTCIVTGPSVGGIGFHAALELARRGARVVLAGRSTTKLDESRAAILADVPEAIIEQLSLDLADLSSVRRAGAAAARLGPIDVLVNNAGVMAPPFARTPDGLEQQMATNHFGPFLLTGLLLPQLAASGDGRMVIVASHAHRIARRIRLTDPRQQTGRYHRWQAYGQSKLAALLTVRELDRRCREAGLPVRALAAHPGMSGTRLAASHGGMGIPAAANVFDAAFQAVGQSPALGALPTLMAATADLPGGTYCGPSGVGQLAGRPKVVTPSPAARDAVAAAALWTLSEETVGLRYP